MHDLRPITCECLVARHRTARRARGAVEDVCGVLEGVIPWRPSGGGDARQQRRQRPRVTHQVLVPCAA
eukprot:3926921-Prymnesium_polylepis.1